MQHILCLFLVALVRASVVPVEPVAKAPVAVVTGVESVPVPAAVVPVVEAKSEVPVVPYAAPAAVPAVPAAPVAAQAAPVPIAAAAPAAVPAVAPEVPKVAAAPVAPVVEAVAKAPVVEEAPAEKHAQDASGVLNEPIDKATKLVIDLDEHLKKYLPAEDEIVAPTSAPHSYSGSDVGEAEADRQNQMTTLIDQVNRLAESIENTITDLVARRRYVTAAMLRSMLNYVRRVRVNLERLQNRLQSVQAVATSGQNAPPSATAIPGASFFNPIRDRINRLTEEIGALVTRIRSTFTPGAATASPLPPLATASPSEVSAAAASASIASAVGTMNASGQQGAVVAASVATSA